MKLVQLTQICRYSPDTAPVWVNADNILWMEMHSGYTVIVMPMLNRQLEVIETPGEIADRIRGAKEV